MKEIELTRGLVTQVDDEDYEHLSKLKWYTKLTQRGTKYTAATWIDGKDVSMGRYLLNPIGNEQVDHIDTNPLNHQKSNLRICSAQQNSCNRNKRMGSINKFKGVYKVKGYSKWRAQIRTNTKLVSLGNYDTPIDAALQYDAAAVYCFREFANINFPEYKEDYLRQAEELDKMEEDDAEC